MKSGTIIAAIAAFALLSGCASSGNQSLAKETEETVAQKITEGETRQSEVQGIFGSPMNTTFTDGGNEVWEYMLTDTALDPVSYVPIVNMFGSSASGTQKKLTILFDENDVVRRYSMTTSDVDTKTGVFK